MPKTVFLTGCSSGIGKLTSALFAARGWNVAATARDPAALAGLTGAAVAAFRLDVTDEPTIAEAVARATDRFGGIDVLVNNAGYGLFGPLEGISADQLEEQYKVNVLGLAAVTRHVLPVMRRQHGGTIVNVSSLGGRVTSPFMSAYYSTKFAVEGLSETLRYELEPHGIRVKLIEPNHFKTDFLGRSLKWAEHPAYEPQIGNARAWMLHRDAGAPSAEPIAEAIYQAATDRSWRLRYPVRGRLVLAFHAILPDRLWRRMMAASLTRRPT